MASGIALSTLDEWCFAVSLPYGMQKLRRTFFSDRILQGKTKHTVHIKAFAAEMLTAILLMDLFLGIVIVPGRYWKTKHRDSRKHNERCYE